MKNKTYALKRLNKSWIVENSLEQHVVDERNVMTLTDHPFILKLHSSFWDDKYVYLVLELCLGGELFSYLRKYNKFNEQQARFYIASIIQVRERATKRGGLIDVKNRPLIICTQSRLFIEI